MTRVVVVAADPATRTRLSASLSVRGVEASGQLADLDESALAGADVAVVAGASLVARVFEWADQNGHLAVVAVVADPDIASALGLHRPGAEVRGWAVVASDADEVTLRAAVAAADAGLAAHPAHWRDAPRRRTRRDPMALDDDGEWPESLTPREQEVLDLLSLGLSNRHIAERLGISSHTVKFHVAAIYGKLGVSGRAAAVNRGLRRGLVKM